MGFEAKVLQVVENVTPTRAYFFNGTMFLETEDSRIATRVYNALRENFRAVGVIYGLCGQSETSYDFV